jgi:hypothetical protein
MKKFSYFLSKNNEFMLKIIVTFYFNLFDHRKLKSWLFILCISCGGTELIEKVQKFYLIRFSSFSSIGKRSYLYVIWLFCRMPIKFKSIQPDSISRNYFGERSRLIPIISIPDYLFSGTVHKVGALDITKEIIPTDFDGF